MQGTDMAELPRIIYEGIDASDQNERFESMLLLPGEKVRLDEKKTVSGVDREALKDKLGTEPLTVSATYVRGESRDNGIGGSNNVVLTEYAFEGVEGRHSAASFQGEKGDEHAFGVLMVVDDRLWAVPLANALDPEAQVRLDGSVREITGVVGRGSEHHVHPEGFEGIKRQIGEDGAIGEYAFEPSSFGDAKGPIGLQGFPYGSEASSEEKAVASEAISDVLDDERAKARSDMMAWMQSLSDKWRADGHQPQEETPGANPTSHREREETAAWSEANMLLRGREITGETAMMAAMIATEGRSVDGGKGISARELAESIGEVNRIRKLDAAKKANPGPDVATSMQAASDEWRAKGHQPRVEISGANRESHREHEETAAYGEARLLMRGHQPTPENADIAARIAVKGRTRGDGWAMLHDDLSVALQATLAAKTASGLTAQAEARPAQVLDGQTGIPLTARSKSGTTAAQALPVRKGPATIDGETGVPLTARMRGGAER
jgi:hypothetical protein